MSQAISTPAPAARDLPIATIERTPYALAAVAGALVFALYAITLAPTTAFWDTSEYIATAHILGIPHPPGNPVFVLMARAWELLLAPTGLSVAVRVNLFSAFMGAATAFFWFLVVHRILAYFSGSELVRRVGAGAAVLVSATAFTVWNQSNVNEKVYSVSLFTIGLLSWTAFLWREHVELHRSAATAKSARFHDDNALVFMVFVLALSVGNHLMAFLAAPALLVLLLMVKPQVFLNWKLYGWSVVFGIIGLSVHLFLPIRSELQPIINEAAPTCESIGQAVTSVLTMGNAGCENLSAALAREQYMKPPVTQRQAPFFSQLANYFQYFDWQWARTLMGNNHYFGAARLPFTILFLVLGIYGAWRHRQQDRVSFAYVATLFATLSFGLVFYLNFKYGFHQAQANGLSPELGEVRERDYFFLVSFSIWGLWAGVGIAALWQAFSARLGTGVGALLKGSPVLALAFLPLVLNWPYASRAGDYSARDWAYNLLMSVEPYGVLFTNGDNDTFPLWYLQEVEGIRRDVTVIVWSYLNTPWYAKQIRALTTPCETPGAAREDPTRILCQRMYEPQGPEGLYPENPRYPTMSILPISDAEIDQTTARGYIELPEMVAFEARGIRAGFGPGTMLQAADQFILAIVKQAWGDRPVYFAATTNSHSRLGLDPYAVRQGVAFKLMTPQEMQQPGIVGFPPDDRFTPMFGNSIDIERTSTLLWDTFQHHDLQEKAHWVDGSTRGIPTYYGWAHYALASALSGTTADSARIQRNVTEVEKWMELADR
jgi:hypothetical protein